MKKSIHSASYFSFWGVSRFAHAHSSVIKANVPHIHHPHLAMPWHIILPTFCSVGGVHWNLLKLVLSNPSCCRCAVVWSALL